MYYCCKYILFIHVKHQLTSHHLTSHAFAFLYIVVQQHTPDFTFDTFKCKLCLFLLELHVSGNKEPQAAPFYLPHSEDTTCFAASVLLKAACVCFNFCLVWVQPLKRVSGSSQLCIPLPEQKTPAAAITCSFSLSVCGPVHKHTEGTKPSRRILI